MPADDLFIDVTADCKLRFLWDDRLAELAQQGETDILRASFVEPDSQGRWWADLFPSDGPRFGPFIRRGDALAAEQAWLLAQEEI